MRRAAALLLGAALSGCALFHHHHAPARAPAARTCDAALATKWIGRRWTGKMLEPLRRRTGARGARALRPGTMGTMDFRPDRLTVTVDAEGRIERLACT